MKITKKQQIIFYKEARQILFDLGATELNVNVGYDLFINTSIGRLSLRVDSDNSIIFSVYSNFTDQANEAKERFGHWKQNVHSTDSVQEALAEVKYFYSRILQQIQL